MRRRAATVALLLAALALPGRVVAGDSIAYVPASPRNYQHAARRASAVDLIVIHASEGSYGGTISWFENPRARASANYVVGRSGSVTEMVPWWDIAWHAGNGWVNAHSIGIEHEGFTNTPWTFTDAQYRASAQLVAQLARRFRVPLDRRHIIGHYQVPDPFHPGLFGGWAHHTDPGPYWNWTRYMRYVRTYTAGAVPPPLPFDVTIPSPAFGSTVGGLLHLEGVPAGTAATAHVDFLVDGKAVSTSQTAPYALDFETSTLANGNHTFGVHAVATDGEVASSTLVLKVQNAWPRLRAVTVTNDQTLSGVVPVTATTTGRVLHVDFLVDGVVRASVAQPPYTWSWDTTADAAGQHTLIVHAVGARRDATRTLTVTVAN